MPLHLTKSKIHYKISLASATEHLFKIVMHVELSKKHEQSSLIVALPAWIPGSYMIRDFARNLHDLKCNNEQICITQIDKQQWQLQAQNDEPIQAFTLSYTIYANDLSVRSAVINDQYAFFNGTSVFLCLKAHELCEHRVSIQTPSLLSNNKLASALPVLKEENINDSIKTAININTNDYTHYACNDYFELIDHPVLLGEFEQHSFTVRKHQFHIVFTGQHQLDLKRIEQDLQPIIEHHIDLFGEFPCTDYWFITLVCDKGFGGLEHLASTVLQYSRFDLPMIGDSNTKTPAYRQFLSLCSHELFHTWHVKRIKPEVMHQPDLFNEVYTPQLWIYEGFTSFYDDLSLARSGIITPQQYIDILNESITRLLRNPGRLKQSVATSSFEAWSKFYKQDAGSLNHIVSYYNKGAVVALCLDISLRQASNNRVSLDTLMQRLWTNYGMTNKGTPNNVIELLCKQSFDLELAGFLHMATQTEIDLPLENLLSFIGLNLLKRQANELADKGDLKESSLKFDLGFSTNTQDGFIKVAGVQTARAGSLAGLQVNDIMIASKNFKFDNNVFTRQLKAASLGESIQLHVMRDGRLLSLNYPVLPAAPDTCEINIIDNNKFCSWLGLNI